MKKLFIKLSQASGTPYYRQIVDQIAEQIRSGALPPDTRLPSVRELAQELLVSLITIRRAYSDLEAAGLIIRKQGFGTFVRHDVATASREQARREARSLLESAIVKAKQMGMSDAEILETANRLIERK